METYTFTFTRRSSLVSIFNLVLFAFLAFAGLISFEGFFLGFLMSENVAIILGIAYFFFFRKGIDRQRAWKTFGVGGTIVYILLFFAAIYPYVGEWILYMGKEFEYLVVLAALIGFLTHVSGKIKMLGALAQRKKGEKIGNANIPHKRFGSKGIDSPEEQLLISIFIWFIGLGILLAL